jgi:outer membrane lipoprotein-sorting protein
MNALRICCTLALCAVSLSMNAQNAATQALDAAAAAYQRSGGIEAAFAFQSTKDGQLVESGQGTIRLQGGKWALTLPTGKTWNDGRTQWTLSDANDEVYISDAEADGSDIYNPSTYFSLHRKGYQAALGDTNRFQGKPVTSITLTSTNPSDTFARVILYLGAGYEPLLIRYFTASGGYEGEIVLREYKTGLRLPDKTFVFDAAQYPHAEIIDLR